MYDAFCMMHIIVHMRYVCLDGAYIHGDTIPCMCRKFDCFVEDACAMWELAGQSQQFLAAIQSILASTGKLYSQAVLNCYFTTACSP